MRRRALQRREPFEPRGLASGGVIGETGLAFHGLFGGVFLGRLLGTADCAALLSTARTGSELARRTCMPGTIEKKLTDLGIVLPKPVAPVANYVPFVRTGTFMVVSGQLCLDAEGKLVAKGQLGGGVSIEDGQKAARACAINLAASSIRRPVSPMAPRS
jgi:hypothetical protein